MLETVEFDCNPRQGHAWDVLASHSTWLVSYRFSQGPCLKKLGRRVFEETTWCGCLPSTLCACAATKNQHTIVPPPQRSKRKKGLLSYCCKNTYFTSEKHKCWQVTAQAYRFEYALMIPVLPQFWFKKVSAEDYADTSVWSHISGSIPPWLKARELISILDT